MIESLVVAFFTALLGAIGYLFVNWMKDVDHQLEKLENKIEDTAKTLGKLDRYTVSSADCYTRFVRVRQAFERDRFRLNRLEQQLDLQSPHPKKNGISTDEESHDHH